MVDVAHDGDDRRARQRLVLRVGLGFLFEEGVRIVELGGERRVAHFLDDDHRRLLVELLVDRDHLAELHQLLDDLGRLDRHLVREVGDVIVSGMCTSCAWNSAGATKVLGAPSLRSPRRPRARRAPAGAAGARRRRAAPP